MSPCTFKIAEKPSLGLVVAVHETPASLANQFREQLEGISRHFTIASLEVFARLWEHPPKSDAKPPILFTFDDGRESNYTVAAPLLESRIFWRTRSVFCRACLCRVRARRCTCFLSLADSRPGDEKWEDWKPMSPGQIAELAARGHAIGNHTLTHERLVGRSPENLEWEIGDSARKLSDWTKKPVDAFAWTFGWGAIDSNAWAVAQRHHRFCFAPCPGRLTPATIARRCCGDGRSN